MSGSSYGLGLPNLSSNRPVNRSEIGATSKMLPFMNNHSASNPNHPSNAAAAGFGGPRHLYEPPLGLGMSGLGIGMNNDGGMSANPMGYLTAQNGSLNHMSANKPPSNYFTFFFFTLKIENFDFFFFLKN